MAAVLRVAGSQFLMMDYEVFGEYHEQGCKDGRQRFLGTFYKGSSKVYKSPSISWERGGGGKWWIHNPSGYGVFWVQSDSELPPDAGWKKRHGEEPVELRVETVSRGSSKKDQDKKNERKTHRNKKENHKRKKTHKKDRDCKDSDQESNRTSRSASPRRHPCSSRKAKRKRSH